jgi:hypothetical protein
VTPATLCVPPQPRTVSTASSTRVVDGATAPIEKRIAARELWLFQNALALASVQRGIEDAREGRTIEGESFAQYADIDIDD